MSKVGPSRVPKVAKDTPIPSEAEDKGGTKETTFDPTQTDVVGLVMLEYDIIEEVSDPDKHCLQVV